MRLLYALPVLAAVLFLTGCVNVKYVGEVYAPTQDVRLFMNEKDVPANTYREMGTVVVSINDNEAIFHSDNILSEKIIEKGMSVGADAAVIISHVRYKVGTVYNTNTNTTYRERTKGKSTAHHGRHRSHERSKSVTRGRSETYSTTSKQDIMRDEITARFLKRK